MEDESESVIILLENITAINPNDYYQAGNIENNHIVVDATLKSKGVIDTGFTDFVSLGKQCKELANLEKQPIEFQCANGQIAKEYVCRKSLYVMLSMQHVEKGKLTELSSVVRLIQRPDITISLVREKNIFGLQFLQYYKFVIDSKSKKIQLNQQQYQKIHEIDLD